MPRGRPPRGWSTGAAASSRRPSSCAARCSRPCSPTCSLLSRCSTRRTATRRSTTCSSAGPARVCPSRGRRASCARAWAAAQTARRGSARGGWPSREGEERRRGRRGAAGPPTLRRGRPCALERVLRSARVERMGQLECAVAMWSCAKPSTRTRRSSHSVTGRATVTCCAARATASRGLCCRAGPARTVARGAWSARRKLIGSRRRGHSPRCWTRRGVLGLDREVQGGS